jgi:hypothetical protein
MTVKPVFKAFKFNALTKRAVDAKFGRLQAHKIHVEVCGFAATTKEKADSSSENRSMRQSTSSLRSSE